MVVRKDKVNITIIEEGGEALVFSIRTTSTNRSDRIRRKYLTGKKIGNPRLRVRILMKKGLELNPKLIFLVARIALVLSRPIGQELGEKHEALTGEKEIEG